MKRKKLNREQFIDLVRNNRTKSIENLNLSGVDLSSIDFDRLNSGNMYYVTFIKCSFEKANLKNSSFCQFYFEDCNFLEADINEAKFNEFRFKKYENNIESAKYKKHCPSDGSFYAWKVVSLFPIQQRDFVLCKLLVPSDAKRVSVLGESKKCRTNKAKVIGFYDVVSGKKLKEIDTAYSYFAPYKICKEFVYKIGETIESKLDTSIMEECTSGIHFFYKKRDAIIFSYRM